MSKEWSPEHSFRKRQACSWEVVRRDYYLGHSLRDACAPTGTCSQADTKWQDPRLMRHNAIGTPDTEAYFADYTTVSIEQPTQSLKNHTGKEASVMGTVFQGRTLRSTESKELGPKHRGCGELCGPPGNSVLFRLQHLCQCIRPAASELPESSLAWVSAGPDTQHPPSRNLLPFSQML